MGCGTWTTKDWDSYTTTRGFSRTSSASELYKNSAMKDEFNPKNIDVRESCDSNEHPNSSPIILGLDVTGSMSSVLETVSLKLNTLITEIFKREPVTDPQIMFLAFGDEYYDRCPLQATQFESDIRIAEQLNDVYFERGGGGNGGESYALPTEVSRKYEIYHLIVDPVPYQEPEKQWKNMLENIDNIPEVIISILEIHAGKSVDEVADSWDGSTSVVVRNAISNLSVSSENEGLVEF